LNSTFSGEKRKLPSWDRVDGDACSYGIWWDYSRACTTLEQAWVSLNLGPSFDFDFSYEI